MRHSHFAALRPVCPVCRTLGADPSPLGISLVEAEHGEDILAGVLGCSACGAEYPIIDGMPVLVPDVRRYVQDNLFYLMARDDVTPERTYSGFDRMREQGDLPSRGYHGYPDGTRPSIRGAWTGQA